MMLLKTIFKNLPEDIIIIIDKYVRAYNQYYITEYSKKVMKTGMFIDKPWSYIYKKDYTYLKNLSFFEKYTNHKALKQYLGALNYNKAFEPNYEDVIKTVDNRYLGETKKLYGRYSGDTWDMIYKKDKQHLNYLAGEKTYTNSTNLSLFLLYKSREIPEISETILVFPKYIGKTFEEIYETNKAYLEWLVYKSGSKKPQIDFLKKYLESF
jgi:hypothetical protein